MNPTAPTPKKTRLKKLLIVLIILVVCLGIFLGNRSYQARKKIEAKINPSLNKNPNKTAFQTRTATSGKSIVTGQQTEEGEEEVQNPIQNKLLPLAKPRLVQLWKEPVSGFDFINKDREIISTSTATTTIKIPATASSTTSSTTTTTIILKKTIIKNQAYVYFWDRASGHVYENIASTSDVLRISNHTFPGREEVYFIDPITVLARGLDESNESIQTTYLQLFKESATSTLFAASEKNVAVNSKLISISKDSKKMFYFIEKTGQGVVTNLDLSSFLRVIKTSITEWVPQYVNKTTLAATTKASAYFQGYLFFINSAGSTENQYILGDKYGFTTLVSPDGKKVLYSEIQEDFLQTSIYDISSKKIVALTQSTLPEKCVWTQDSKKILCAIPQKLDLLPYPDVWYQGLTAFTDNLWTIDPVTGEFDVLVALQDQVSNPIDAYNLKVSVDYKYLLFQDKYTLTLWKYDL